LVIFFPLVVAAIRDVFISACGLTDARTKPKRAISITAAYGDCLPYVAGNGWFGGACRLATL
jgi:hypothetical protein